MPPRLISLIMGVILPSCMGIAATLTVTDDTTNKTLGTCSPYSNLAIDAGGNVSAKAANCNFGSVVAAPGIKVSGNGVEIVNNDTVPTPADFTWFSNQAVGTTFTRQFTIQNTGTAVLTVTSITTSPADNFTIPNPPTSMAPISIASGSSSSFQVAFKPSSAISYNAKVSIANNTTATPSYTFTIQGSGSTSGATNPAVTVTDKSNNSVIALNDTIDFGRVQVSSSTEKEFGIYNTGNVELNVPSLPSVSGANSAEFLVSFSPIPSYPIKVAVGVGASSNLKVQFKPTIAGSRTATISIKYNNSSYNFTVTGTAYSQGTSDPGIGTGLWRPAGTTNIFVVDQSMPGGQGSTTYVPGCANYGDYTTTNCGFADSLSVNSLNVISATAGNTISIRYKPTAKAGTTPTSGSFQVGGQTGGTIKRITDAWLSKVPPISDLTDTSVASLLGTVNAKCQSSSNTTASIITGTEYCNIGASDSVWYLNIRPRSSATCAAGTIACIYKIDENSKDLQ